MSEHPEKPQNNTANGEEIQDQPRPLEFEKLPTLISIAKAEGETTRSLSRRLNISRSTLYRWEEGASYPYWSDSFENILRSIIRANRHRGTRA